MSSSVDQVSTVVLYSNDSYVKSVAIEEPGYVFTCGVPFIQTYVLCAPFTYYTPSLVCCHESIMEPCEGKCPQF